MRKSLNIQIFFVVIALLFPLITKNAYPAGNTKDQEVIRESLIKLANDLNRQMPVMMDAETRCNYVLASGLTLTYNYTLVNINDPKILTKQMIEKSKQSIINSQCGNPRIKKVMRAGMKTLYFYNDKNGNYITDFETGIKDCL